MMLWCVPVSECPKAEQACLVPIAGQWGAPKLAIVLRKALGDGEYIVQARRKGKWEVWHYRNGVAERGVNYNVED